MAEHGLRILTISFRDLLFLWIFTTKHLRYDELPTNYGAATDTYCAKEIACMAKNPSNARFPLANSCAGAIMVSAVQIHGKLWLTQRSEQERDWHWFCTLIKRGNCLQSYAKFNLGFLSRSKNKQRDVTTLIDGLIDRMCACKRSGLNRYYQSWTQD